MKKSQSSVYRHILNFYAVDATGTTFVFMMSFISTNNLKVDSLQNLSLLLKPTANSKYPIGPAVNIDSVGVIDYSYIAYSNGVWKVSSYSEPADADISSVSDSVTPL